MVILSQSPSKHPSLLFIAKSEINLSKSVECDWATLSWSKWVELPIEKLDTLANQIQTIFSACDQTENEYKKSLVFIMKVGVLHPPMYASL